MRTSEHQSAFELMINIGARIAAPLALSYLARNAIFRVSGGTELNLALPANRQPLKTTEEKRFFGLLRKIDRYVRATHDRYGIEVEYESLAVSGSTDNPTRSKRKIPHHRPDLAVALRGTLPCAAPAPISDSSHIAVFELGRTIEGNQDKADQAKHALKAGLANYHQFDGDGITGLFKAFNQDPDGTLLDIFGEAIFR